jgi:hypothetical protein
MGPKVGEVSGFIKRSLIGDESLYRSKELKLEKLRKDKKFDLAAALAKQLNKKLQQKYQFRIDSIRKEADKTKRTDISKRRALAFS